MRPSFLAGFLFLFALGAFGQNETATITGTVTDQDSAVVSGALIQAKNVQTGALYKTTSSAEGNYEFRGLPPGTYLLSNVVPALAFGRDNVVVQPSQTLNIDLRAVDLSLNTLGEDRVAWYGKLASPHPTPNGLTPRTADGKPDLSGVWWEPRVLEVEDAAVLPWAAALMRERAGNIGKDPPRTRCLPTSPTLLGFFGVNRLVQTPTLLVVLTEADIPGYREIFLDGRGQPSDIDPTWTGHSTGKWEGDTLVVDTIAFNDKSWLLPAGLMPHTEKLHIVSRFRRPDLGHLETEITFEDPGTFAKPFGMKIVSDLAMNEDVQEWICNENNQDVEHLVGK